MPTAVTLKRVVNAFLTSAALTLKPNTVSCYAAHLKRFLMVTKNKRVALLRPRHLIEFMRSWHEWQAVRRCFHWANIEAGIIKRDPFTKVKAPARNHRKRILTPHELAQLLRAPRRAWRHYLLALRELAARPQEVRALEWHELQSEDPGIGIDEALKQGRAIFVMHDYKSRARRRDQDTPRVLLVTPRLGRLLMRMRARDGSREGKVFRNTRGKPWSKNAVRCMFRSMRRRLGIKADTRGENVTAYTMRHSCATLAASRGVLDRVLADWLGHTETRTTRRYQHLNVQHIREALRKMDAPPRVFAAKPEARPDTPPPPPPTASSSK